MSEFWSEFRASTWWNAQHWLRNVRDRSGPGLAQGRYKPLRTVQQVQDQRGSEVWHTIVRRCDQRNTSDRSSAQAALISNISERDRAKDVEHFDEILRNFIDETNKYEGRFGKNPRRTKDSGSAKVDAREFADLSIPWHFIAIRRIAHRAGEHPLWTRSRHIQHQR